MFVGVCEVVIGWKDNQLHLGEVNHKDESSDKLHQMSDAKGRMDDRLKANSFCHVISPQYLSKHPVNQGGHMRCAG